MRLRIGLPEAVFAAVAAYTQHAMLTKSTHQLDELPVIAREEIGIAELRRLITETGEVFGNAAASRLAERYRNRQRSSLRKQAGSGVHRSRAECREGEKATPVHRWPFDHRLKRTSKTISSAAQLRFTYTKRYIAEPKRYHLYER